MSVTAFDESIFAHVDPWTEEDWLALPDVPVRIELVSGVLVVNPAPDVPHQRLVRDVGNAIDNARPDDSWEVLPGLAVRLWRDHVRIPDLVVLRSDAVGVVPVADVLMLCEITSPGNFRQDMIAKHGEYAEAGLPFSLRIDLHNGIDAATPTAYELVDGSYREYSSAPDGVLRLERPWPLEADLRVLARGRTSC